MKDEKYCVGTMTLFVATFRHRFMAAFRDRGKFTVLQYTKKILSVTQTK